MYALVGREFAYAHPPSTRLRLVRLRFAFGSAARLRLALRCAFGYAARPAGLLRSQSPSGLFAEYCNTYTPCVSHSVHTVVCRCICITQCRHSAHNAPHMLRGMKIRIYTTFQNTLKKESFFAIINYSTCINLTTEVYYVERRGKGGLCENYQA